MTSLFARLSAYQPVGVRIFLLSIASWLFTLQLINDEREWWQSEVIAFCLGVSVIFYVLLKKFGYFHLLRVHLRKSDVLPILFAVPLSALISDAVFRVLTGRAICGVESLVYASIVLSLLMFASDVLLRVFDGRRGKTSRVALLVSAADRREIRALFRMRGLSSRIVYLNRSDLEREIALNGAGDIDLIVIAEDRCMSFNDDSVIVQAHLLGIPIVDRRSLTVELSEKVSLNEVRLWNYILEATPQTPLVRLYCRGKELLEPAVALLLMIALAPVFALVALAIKLSDGGPILFRQRRIGYAGKEFTLIKFRSMRVDAEKGGPQFCALQDNRVTRFGTFLRRSRLDELPQLINIIVGEMSFVGPRPERPEMYESLTREIPLFWIRTLVRPGITGWAQVHAGYAATVEESREKLEYDLYYIQHMSPRIDVVSCLLTIKSIFTGVRTEKRQIDRFNRSSIASEEPLSSGDSSESLRSAA